MKCTKPFLSIIIPTYNSGQTIRRALDSITGQTFKDFEVLVMDGQSTDDTVRIVEAYKKYHSHIKIFSERDKGVYEAMNKGIELSRGEWLYFLGSDDFLYQTNTIEEFSKLDNLVEVDVCYGNVYYTYTRALYNGKFDFQKLIKRNICHQAIFFRKEVFDKIGKFNLKYRIHADWDHNIRWFYSSKIVSKYVDLTFATFTHGGISSLYKDKIFERDKNFLLLSKGIGKLSFYQVIRLNEKIIAQLRREKSYTPMALLISINFVCKVLNKSWKLLCEIRRKT